MVGMILVRLVHPQHDPAGPPPQQPRIRRLPWQGCEEATNRAKTAATALWNTARCRPNTAWSILEWRASALLVELSQLVRKMAGVDSTRL